MSLDYIFITYLLFRKMVGTESLTHSNLIMTHHPSYLQTGCASHKEILLFYFIILFYFSSQPPSP